MIDTKIPKLITKLPGPKATEALKLDAQYISPSYTRDYPMVAKTGRGAMVEDVDGNVFLDFAAGIAVVSTGHCHPDVVKAIQALPTKGQQLSPPVKIISVRRIER